jgi:hypothetical protein
LITGGFAESAHPIGGKLKKRQPEMRPRIIFFIIGLFLKWAFWTSTSAL